MFNKVRMNKMRDLKSYFSDAQDDANDNFFSYDGGFNDDYVANGETFSNFGGDDDAFMMSGRSAPTSQPYIVSVKNSNTATGFPVTILNSYGSLQETAPSYGNNGAISIVMGISGVSYKEFLYQAMNKPFVVGLTYFQSSSQAQVLETLTLIQRDVNGNESMKTLVPTIDPYQQQSTIIALNFTYKIDGFTSVVISSVLASTTAKVYFYPAETSSIARPLAGDQAVEGYSNPRVVREPKLKISGSTMSALD
jgi:hypothetical protein